MHDLSSDELIAGLHNATLEPAVMFQHIDEQTAGIEFELLRTYPRCVALTGAHPFARLKSISLEKVAAPAGIERLTTTPVIRRFLAELGVRRSGAVPLL